MIFLKNPKIQTLLFFLVVVLLYFIAWRPKEAVTDLVVDNNLVYLAGRSIGVRVLDTSNPLKPSRLSAVNPLGSAQRLWLDKETKRLYVADGGRRVAVLEVSDPAAPKQSARIDAGGSVQDVVAEEGLIFVAAGRRGLKTFKTQEGGSIEEVKDAWIDADVTRIAAVNERIYAAVDRESIKAYQVIEKGKRLQEIGSYTLEDQVNDLLAFENKVYLATEDHGLVMLQVSDLVTSTVTLTEMMHYTTPEPVMGLAVDGLYVYIAQGKKGLQILDATNPAYPREVGAFDTWGYSYQVGVDEKLVYLADGASGLRILVGGVLLNPEIEGASSQSSTESASKANHYLYLADGGRGLRVLKGDASDLHEVGFYDTPGYAEGVWVRASDSKAFVADGEEFLIFDVARPEEAVKLQGAWRSNKGEKEILDVQVLGNYAYLAQGQYGMSVIDVSILSDPKMVGEEEIRGKALDLDIIGDLVYVASGYGGLNIVSITDPTLPSRVANWELSGEARAVDAASFPGYPTYAYVAASKAGLCVVDATNPYLPQELDCLPMPGAAMDVAVADEQRRAYAVDLEGNLYIYSLENPAEPERIGSLALDFPLYGVTVDGNVLYLSAVERGFRVVDATNAAQPQVTFQYDIPPYAYRFTVRDKYAYVADGAGGLGLRILDISEKKEPTEIGIYRSPGQAKAVAVQNDLAFLADGEKGLQVVDIANPLRPVLVGALELGGDATHLALNGPYAYVANRIQGLQTVDISDPRRPKLVGTLRAGLPGEAAWVVPYRGEYVLVSCLGGGLAGVYVKDAKAPQLVGIFDEFKDLRSLVLVDHYALAAGGKDGLIVLDVMHPAKIERIAQIPTDGEAENIFVRDNYAFLASGAQGVQVFSITDMENPYLVGATKDLTSASYIAAEWLAPDEKQKEPGAYRLYIADGEKGLRFFLLKKSSYVFQVGGYETPGTATFLELFHYVAVTVNEEMLAAANRLGEMGLTDVSKAIEEARQGFAKPIKEFAKAGGTTWPRTPALQKARWTLWRFLVFDILIFFAASFCAWLGFFGQFALPVRGRRERWLTWMRLILFSLGCHGTLARVIDGQIYQSEGDAKRQGPGVALVQLTNAVLIEKRNLKRHWLGELLLKLAGLREPTPEAPFGIMKLENGQGEQPIPSERVEGPGIVFTSGNPLGHNVKYDEAIVKAIDLRSQVRTTIENIRATTVDGIEVEAKVFCTFTLGLPPDDLLVTYKDGEECAEALRVVDFELNPDLDARGNPRSIYKVKALKDDLDDEDKQEIHRNLAQIRSLPALENPFKKNGAPPGRPFLYEEERAIAAATARGENSPPGKPIEWTDLPERTAVEVFRNLLAREAFDILYRPVDPDPQGFPLRRLKTDFGCRVRNLGLLAYQFVEPREASQGYLVEGTRWEEKELAIYAARRLTTPKVLRARGIKVIAAGFTELKPVNPMVHQQLLKAWMVNWQKGLARLDHETQAERMRSEGEAQAKQDMANALVSMFKEEEGRDVLASRILQYLETAAANPAIRQLIPPESLEVLNVLQGWSEKP